MAFFHVRVGIVWQNARVRGLVAAALVSALGLSFPSLGAAQSAVENGRARFLEADFEGSRASFREAVNEDALGTSDLVQSLLHLSAIAALLGEDDLARERAEDAVALDADARAPEGAPATMAELLDELRDRAAPVQLRVVVDRTHLDAPRVVAHREGGLHLATELVLTCGEAESLGDEEAALPLAPGVDRCEATLQTEAGSVLVNEALSIAALGEAGPNPDGSNPDAGDPLDGSDDDGAPVGLILGVVGGVVVAAIAVVLALTLASPGPPQLTQISVEGS